MLTIKMFATCKRLHKMKIQLFRQIVAYSLFSALQKMVGNRPPNKDTKEKRKRLTGCHQRWSDPGGGEGAIPELKKYWGESI